jgi:hypothetical protein
MADILTTCPKTGRTIRTRVTSEMVTLDSLPRVAIPVRCHVCGNEHTWTSSNAWIAGNNLKRTAAE